MILSGFNPESFGITNSIYTVHVLFFSQFYFTGKEGWYDYPQLKCFMEMVITRQITFPPPTMAADNVKLQEIFARENQIKNIEQETILEYENHLANETITKDNSLLLSMTMLLDAKGPARAPPPQVLEDISRLVNQYHLGIMLCKSRDPDFLSDLIQTQGTTQSRPWLAELVESNNGALDHLPVQCLCEFLLHDTSLDDESNDWFEDTTEKGSIKVKSDKQALLLDQLQGLLYNGTSEVCQIIDILQFFLQRLLSPSKSARLLATKGLSQVIVRKSSDSSDEDNEGENDDKNPMSKLLPNYRWLFEQLVKIQKFDDIRSIVCEELIQAVRVETNSQTVSAYIVFLSSQSQKLDLQLIEAISEVRFYF